jgi:Papain family cysteine protease
MQPHHSRLKFFVQNMQNVIHKKCPGSITTSPLILETLTPRAACDGLTRIALRFCAAAITVMVVAVGSYAFAQNPPAAPTPELNGPAYYQARLAAAPPAIRAQLDELQRSAASAHWSFEVGYTSVLDIPLARLTGTRIPANYEAVATKQNRFAVEALRLNNRLLSATGVTSSPLACNIGARTCDYQPKMTPVKMQGSCGSCWDFAALGAWEGVYRLKFNQLVDASEQQVLTCSNGGTCAGGWWDPVYVWMVGTGAGTEAQTPYTGIDGPCLAHPPASFKVAAWGFVTNKASVPTVDQLKQALVTHGPLVVGVFATPAFQAYTTGVFDENANNNSINHAVVIVGWDDSKRAWQIKNSWSTAWGEAGYMWIKYGSNKIGYAAAWVLPVAPQLVAVRNQRLMDLVKRFNIR